MADPPVPSSPMTLLSTLGEEIIRIVTPVSACMLIVVLLVTALSSTQTLTYASIATIAYSESTSDSFWGKLTGALFNTLAFVAVITLVTFILVLLFYFRFTNFLKSYMGFSSFVVLSFLGGEICSLLLSHFAIPIDVISFSIVLVNFSVVGMMAVFLSKMPISVTQGYLVVIGVLVAYFFTMLPEWTTWSLLIGMAVYDLAAVLLPVGPLRLLVEMAISRDEEIPALVYEARPVDPPPNAGRRLWRERRSPESDSGSNSSNLVESTVVEVNVAASSDNLVGRRDVGANEDSNLDCTERRNLEAALDSNSDRSTLRELLQETRLVIDEEEPSDLSAPLITRPSRQPQEEGIEQIGLGSSGAIKLGLGDFIFYSVLVGRAALYDFMTVYACYLAIMAGLGITLLLLAFYQKALPALPISIMFGVLFYLLTRTLLEVFVVQCSTNLLMF